MIVRAMMPLMLVLCVGGAGAATPLPGECAVLSAAIGSLSSRDFNHQPPGRLKLHEDAMPLERLDGDWTKHFPEGSLTPPRATPPLALRSCVAAPSAVEFVPSKAKAPGENCAVGDGLGISRAAIDAGGGTAVVAVVENGCGTDGWLIWLTRTSDGDWRPAKPENRWFSVFEPRR